MVQLRRVPVKWWAYPFEAYNAGHINWLMGGELANKTRRTGSVLKSAVLCLNAAICLPTRVCRRNRSCQGLRMKVNTWRLSRPSIAF